MEAPKLEVEAIPCDAAPELPNIWLPELVERYASSLHPNEVVGTLCCLDKATAEQFRGRPEFAAVHLSQPVPPHAFASRWASPGAMRDLNLEQRKQLLRLTAASGVVANLELALEVVGFIPDSEDLVTPLKAAASAGHIGAIKCLFKLGFKLGPRFALEIGPLLGAAVEAGHRTMCEFLMAPRWQRWRTEHVAAALRAGRPEMADWLLQRRPEGPIGPRGSLAPLGAAACGGLLCAAASGCGLRVLKALAWRCSDVGFPGRQLRLLLREATGSRTADWQPKAEWAESQLPPGFPRTSDVCAAAAACPDADLRLAWLLARGYPADKGVASEALCTGNAAALELLLLRGLRPEPRAVGEAANRGRLEALKKLHEHGCPLDAAAVAYEATAGGHLPVLAWAVEELAEVLRARVTSGTLMDAAAGSGNTKLMATLWERECAWGESVYRNAAGAGCQPALEWLAEKGCLMPDGGEPYHVAVHNNDLATLRCLARLGCPWGPASGDGAVFESCLRSRRPLPLLRLLVELGCPVDWKASLAASRRSGWDGSRDVRDWLAAEVARQQQQQQLGHEGTSKRQRAEQHLLGFDRTRKRQRME
ncbi:hypothetical protein GPECTOR_81g209 [Gonium pectorale]|uniref:Ankyrin repeat domain-containing protein n=1 Tax=Gonium pectorale TaxID=33097 RepID=A0A150G1K9_GONPE|nr:hypothetical protein GPECTOR_81g209 [Gonium pectorale]|eukprot:KXZ43759.1 hypothetical protein GPECTOR_81g209 [Gonium pectorale]